MRLFLVAVLVLVALSHSWALTKQERVGILVLCELAHQEAKEGEQSFIPYALECLIEQKRDEEAKRLLSTVKDERVRAVLPFILARTTLKLNITRRPSPYSTRELYGMSAEELKAFFKRHPEARRLLPLLLQRAFYSQNYSRFFRLLEAFPNLNRSLEARRLLALAYYRTGNYAAALAVLSPMRDDFGIFWRWKLKKKLGLPTEEMEKRLSEMATKSTWGALYALLSEKNVEVATPVASGVCQRALLLQRFGLDRRSLDALKECAFEHKNWYLTLPLLPNPKYGVKMLFALPDIPTGKRLTYSFLRPYLAEVRLSAWAYLVDEDLLYAVMRQESVFDRLAVSRSKAMGLMQLLPSTGVWIEKRLGEKSDKDKLLIPFFSIKYGTWYLSHLSEELPEFLAVAAYNCGPTRLKGWLKENRWVEDASDIVAFFPMAQTRRYLAQVLFNYLIYSSQR